MKLLRENFKPTLAIRPTLKGDNARTAGRDSTS